MGKPRPEGRVIVCFSTRECVLESPHGYSNNPDTNEGTVAEICGCRRVQEKEYLLVGFRKEKLDHQQFSIEAPQDRW